MNELLYVIILLIPNIIISLILNPISLTLIVVFFPFIIMGSSMIPISIPFILLSIVGLSFICLLF